MLVEYQAFFVNFYNFKACYWPLTLKTNHLVLRRAALHMVSGLIGMAVVAF